MPQLRTRGLAGSIGPQGAAGNTCAASTVAGPTGLTGVAGAIGTQGPSGLNGSFAFADFFALMPGGNAATVGIGTDVSFPQNGPSSLSATTRTGGEGVLDWDGWWLFTGRLPGTRVEGWAVACQRQVEMS